MKTIRAFLLSDLEQVSVKHNILLPPLFLKGNQDKWYYEKEKLIVKGALFDGFIWWEDWKVEALASEIMPRFHIDVLEQKACMIDNGFDNVVNEKDARNGVLLFTPGKYPAACNEKRKTIE